MTIIFTPINRHPIYLAALAALAGADLDILFRGVDLWTDSHIYTHNYSINNTFITHKMDELSIPMGMFVHKYLIYVR